VAMDNTRQEVGRSKQMGFKGEVSAPLTEQGDSAGMAASCTVMCVKTVIVDVYLPRRYLFRYGRGCCNLQV
jgi:hypothetical protein